MAGYKKISSDVIQSTAFIDMPQSTRLLYYDLCMRVNKDGFTNRPRAIARETGASPCDLELLIQKGFAQQVENGLYVRR